MKNKMSTLLKTVMTVFAALAFMTDTGAQTPKIRSIKYMTYEAAVNSSGKVVPGKIDRTSNRDGYYELYDNKGNTLMYSALLFSDDVYKDNVYIYDASSKLIRQDNYQSDGKELRDYWLYCSLRQLKDHSGWYQRQRWCYSEHGIGCGHHPGIGRRSMGNDIRSDYAE